MTNQEFAAAIVKVFAANPDRLHAVIDALSDDRIPDPEAAIQRLLELPAETTVVELQAEVQAMEVEPKRS